MVLHLIIANSIHRILALYSHVCPYAVTALTSQTLHPLEGKEKGRTEEEGITLPLPPSVL